MPTFCFLLFKNSLFWEGTLHFLKKNRIILPFTHSFTHTGTGYDWNENQLGEKRPFKFLSLLTHNTVYLTIIFGLFNFSEQEFLGFIVCIWEFFVRFML